MGDLLLCGQELASMPYYIDSVSLNIYSLEELCYYLKNHIDEVEPDLMEEELCDWLESELKMKPLAEKLREMIAHSKSLSQFAGTMMRGCGYCTEEEIFGMQQVLKAFENKAEYECRKIRADRMLTKKRYVKCMLEYQKLIAEGEEKQYSRYFLGSVWHNLGTAYAGLFFFKEAANCYETAYQLNDNEDSKDQRDKALQLYKRDRIPSLTPDLAEIADQAMSSLNRGNYTKADEILYRWKNDYIYSCGN